MSTEKALTPCWVMPTPGVLCIGHRTQHECWNFRTADGDYDPDLPQEKTVTDHNQAPRCSCDPDALDVGQPEPQCRIHGSDANRHPAYRDITAPRPARGTVGITRTVLHTAEPTPEDVGLDPAAMASSSAVSYHYLMGSEGVPRPVSMEDVVKSLSAIPRSTGSFAREILEHTAELVNGDRNADYGDALDNFTETAALWQIVLGPLLAEGAVITAEHVALCQDQIKTARLIHNLGHRDSWVDKCGYSSLGGGIVARRQHETAPDVVPDTGATPTP